MLNSSSQLGSWSDLEDGSPHKEDEGAKREKKSCRLGGAWQLHGHASYAIARGPCSEGLCIGGFYCGYLEILNNFVFELVLCKWRLIEWRSMCVRRGLHAICLVAVPCCPICMSPMSSEFPWSHNEPEFSKTQSESKESALHLQLIKPGPWQPWEDTLFVWTRTCYSVRRQWRS